MRVPTLKMQISARKHWILYIYEIHRENKHYTHDEPSFSHTQKKGKLTVTTHFIAKFELHRAFFQSQG